MSIGITHTHAALSLPVHLIPLIDAEWTSRLVKVQAEVSSRRATAAPENQGHYTTVLWNRWIFRHVLKEAAK